MSTCRSSATFIVASLMALPVSADDYSPTVTGDVSDLQVNAAALLRQLPGVTAVDIPSKGEKPTHRIVHLRDWHFVAKESFAADLRDQSKNIGDDEIDRQYSDHLDTVESIQQEQMALLRCLIKHHGLKAVCIEGLAPRDEFILDAQVSVLRRYEPDLVELSKQRDELAQDANDDETKRLLADIDGILLQNRMDLLRIGAAGRLLMTGELADVIGVEDEQAHRAAQPVRKDGRIVLDGEKIEAREDAQVKNIIAGGTFSLVVLGAAHDLTDNVERLEEDVELIVVTMGRVKELTGRDNTSE